MSLKGITKPKPWKTTITLGSTYETLFSKHGVLWGDGEGGKTNDPFLKTTAQQNTSFVGLCESGG